MLVLTETHRLAVDVIIAGVAVVLVLLVLRILSGLPVIARIVLSSVMTAIILLSFYALLVSHPRLELPSAEPEAASGPAGEPPAAGADEADHERPRARSLAGDGAPVSRDGEPGQPSGTAGGTPSPPVGEAAKSNKSAEADWDVVPVFYGTDRAVEAAAPRLRYGAVRARRLETGRAMVTVPRLHQVPRIERPWVIKVPFLAIKIYDQKEDPKRHFTISRIEALDRAAWLQLVGERIGGSAAFRDHAIVFVHGYNTSFDQALYRTAQISYDLKFDGAAFLYSWPSGGSISSYTYDRESAGQSAPYLRQFLELVVRESGAKHVSVIAHSMGNLALLDVLRELATAKVSGVALDQLILAAPDVDRDAFENMAKSIRGLAQGVTLYAAANDRALDVSRRFYGGVPRAGDVPEGGPLVLDGIDTIDVTAASMDSLSLHHSGYAESNALLSDIGLVIQTGERPPDRRTPILERLTASKGGSYWRYPSGK
jgi:esterase/lipase superfamily enzyme